MKEKEKKASRQDDKVKTGRNDELKIKCDAKWRASYAMHKGQTDNRRSLNTTRQLVGTLGS